MPKGAHLKKNQDDKRVKSILLRFTQHEFNQLQNYCRGLGIERSEMVREAVFKAIDFHQQETEAQRAEVRTAEPAPPSQADKSVQEFLEDLVQIFKDFSRASGFNRNIDCNIYRATVHEFTNLLSDYSQKALTEEFKRYCTGLFTADFFNSHLFRGFEIHISNNFVFWNKHNRGSNNYVGY